MLTPKFSLTQDENFVYVTINVPYIRVSSAELITEDCTFTFYCKPYLLKLTFPHAFKEEDEECKATYDPFLDNGTLVATLPKLEPGQHFPDLDLTSKLLFSPTNSTDAKATSAPSIEILGSEEYEASSPMNEENDEEDDTLQYPAQMLNLGIHEVKYGFNSMYAKIFLGMREELLDMTEIKHPDEILPKYRTILRISCENQLFDPARYLGDQLDGELDPIYMEAMTFRSFYNLQWDAWKDKKSTPVEQDGNQFSSTMDPRDRAFEHVGGFTELEKETLSSKLPRKEYLLHKQSKEQFGLLLGLADILFAQCYDHRLTLGDGNVESAHTSARLSCTFSWLEDFSLMHTANTTSVAGDVVASAKLENIASESHVSEVMEPSTKVAEETAVSNVIKFNLRRCIIYPYLRVWKLARKVLADVARILFLGRRAVLKCLLQLRSTFEHTDTHYLLNKIYVDDYCNWIQQDSLTEEALQTFAKLYNAAKDGIEKLPGTGKELMGFFLPELEAWAAKADEEEQGSDSECSNDTESGSDDSSDTSSGRYSDSDSDGESERSSDDGAGTAVDNTAITPASVPAPVPSALSGKTANSSVAEGEEECTVPPQYTDYLSHQRSNPLLQYLVPSPVDELALLGGVSSDKAPLEETTDNDSTLNKMLLLPKRKAEEEAQLDQLISGMSIGRGGNGSGGSGSMVVNAKPAGASGASNKRVLIEELPDPTKQAEPSAESEPVVDASVDVVNQLSQLSVD